MEINEDDWELVNDDGFIYRRLKRPRPASTSTATIPPPDITAEAKARTERKKKVLLNLKTKYQQEIHHWELLSNTLQALQNPTQNQPPPVPLPVSDQRVSVVHENYSDSTYRELTDTLLAQVEAQEASISEISRFCDVAEALCDAEERRLKQPLIDLSIWEHSPRKLITSLLQE
ncbi:hypothetical protein HanRHA438_Chr14g0666091 [Helianthus annuus]|uniref:Uncharacterized protein n=1 Tax=Helianthus annuus TaxID=4232 RepID=A0A251SJP5_HELAN|nr:uncharacterized protein LOC110904132 [Helianthus annuus]KAF5770053.1 hypothetical protein HanXRQr2_Chr14g0655201 [Helianthus annuus]KAJ0465000.1 hypothetical protein HanHA300_Chr14g0533551 [Helianthus annuus]KAJ0486593.1 hypothetical protein HanHA89_Chr14g0581371 [Helianthus annuus]KAJ0657159.1 hypothetical protein HanLR1_Chr14g0543951 [Helianthus annuus]KAJ0660736.1 hypothetical protein HanOQP8_Chr14g0541051 [Helianthus annuus]